MTRGFSVRQADWTGEHDVLRAVREAVFIVEQRVPKALEWDDHDPLSAHVIAEDEAGKAIGTGRLLPDGHIGRMAVLRAWRGRGVGGAMLHALMAIARERGLASLVLSSQLHAVGFYQRHGFRTHGEPYLEAGIPHIGMRRAADPDADETPGPGGVADRTT